MFRLQAAIVLSGLMSTVLIASAPRGDAWKRHVIDNSSRGADGVRLDDVNGDRLLDIVTGWEEGGVIRAYLHPGLAKVRERWPAVTVGTVGSPEDAVFVDLDGDGAVDVVSCCEGTEQSVFVHWAPRDKDKYLDRHAWKTEAFPMLKGMSMWMFCLPLQIDGRHGFDLFFGAKGKNARIGWLEAPANPRQLAAWKWHPLYDAGWIMSLVAEDVDVDGDLDIIASDRKGRNRGCLWLENPGPKAAAEPWQVHRIGGHDHEVMFLDVVDLDQDGLRDVVVAVRDEGIIFYRRQPGKSISWRAYPIDLPQGTGDTKSVRVGDIDGDGKLDIVYTCEGATGGKSGCVWLSYGQAATDRAWELHEISGPQGIKFDLVQLLDIDSDGDLDVLTCEERTNLGVFWYENPTRPRVE